jgi:hypothetical protein
MAADREARGRKRKTNSEGDRVFEGLQFIEDRRYFAIFSGFCSYRRF